MLFKSLVKAALVATAIAQPVQHQHHQHEKKDIVYQTVVVTAGSGDSAATTTAAAVSTVASGTATDSAASASSTFSGSAKGVSYSPYADDGTCKDASTVKLEVAALSGFEIIRIYGVDCSQVEYVIAGMSSGQKLFAGIYDMSSISSAVSTIASAVEAAGGWDIIDTISVGNELVNAGTATPSQIKGYVNEARSALTSAGYTGSVVSVDTFIAVINNPELCDYSDYMAVNAHPFFDGGVAAANSGEWVQEQIDRVSSACGGKTVFITETGWPTRGDSNGDAVPGSSEQSSALSSISSACGSSVTFFTAYNDLWKAPGYLNVEQYWGILN